jgi:hypothetical protein
MISEKFKNRTYQIDVDNQDRICLIADCGKVHLKAVKQIHLAPEKILSSYFQENNYAEAVRFDKYQSVLSNYTDFRVYEYIRLTGGVEDFQFTSDYNIENSPIKIVYLGDILIALLKHNGIISSSLIRLNEGNGIYQYIAKQIKQTNSICGEIPIEEILIINETHNKELVKLPQCVDTKGGYTNAKAERVVTAEIQVVNTILKVNVTSNYIYTPTKLIDGVQQKPVKVIYKNIDFGSEVQ